MVEVADEYVSAHLRADEAGHRGHPVGVEIAVGGHRAAERGEGGETADEGRAGGDAGRDPA